MIEGIVQQLRAFDDATLRRDIEGRPDQIAQLVERFFHCG